MDSEQRDAQLRGSLLNHARLKAHRDPQGWVSGSMLLLAARDEDRNPADGEDQATRLLDELVELQFIDEQQAIGTGIGKRTLDHRRYRITEKGRDYYFGVTPAVPGVEVFR